MVGAEVVSLLSDSEGDPLSPPKSADTTTGLLWGFSWLTATAVLLKPRAGNPFMSDDFAGLKRKRSEPVQNQIPSRPLAAHSHLKACHSGLSQSPSFPSAQAKALPAAKQSASEENDDDLCVELAFAKKPKVSLQHPDVNAAFGGVAADQPLSSHDAALGHGLLDRSYEFVSQPSPLRSWQTQGAEDAQQEEVVDVPDDYLPETAGPAK